ncbi:MAG TPA: NnrS family protein, partial [Nitrolancea sp.]
AMSARLFPLYATTQLPYVHLLSFGAAALVIGLFVRLIGNLAHIDALSGCGQIAQAAGIGAAIIALRVFERRRTLPRRQVRIRTDPLQLHLISAYAWLGLAGVLLWFNGLNRLGLELWHPGMDAERHALGAGFVTLLIFGVGSEMLPGFAQQALRRPQLRWATLALGNLAALLRIAPLLFPGSLSTQGNAAVMSSAGLLGALAIGLFLVNIPVFRRARPSRT